jgi:2'-hydroxyisoflavone reductase
MPSRRDFLKTSAAAGGALLAGGAPNVARATTVFSSTQAEAPLSILILGGTGFIGPHLVKHAVERGHTVTIFTRGRREADLPDSVIRLQGDRDGQLGALVGKTPGRCQCTQRRNHLHLPA